MRLSSLALSAAILALPLTCRAEQEMSVVKSIANVSAPPSPPVHALPKLKLTTRQQRGVQLLRAARAEAAGLEPVMRGMVLQQIAEAYDVLNPQQADSIRRDAFLASLEIEKGASWSREECYASEICEIKSHLQTGLLTRMVRNSRSEVEHLLRRAEPQARFSVTAWLISDDVKKKNFDHAEELIRGVSAEGDFPYGEAVSLMNALPEQRFGDRLTIFSQGLQNFRDYGNSLPSSDDLATMLFEVWRQLPQPLVVEAIDTMLSKAKADDETRGPVRIALHSAQDDVSFNSAYEFRVFQLLAILKEIDSERANSLLRDHQQLRAAFERLPGGPLSAGIRPNPDLASPGVVSRISISVAAADPSPPNVSEQMQLQMLDALERHEEQIRREAAKNPESAIADAVGLPVQIVNDHWVGSPRGDTLLVIAQIAWRKNPSAAKVALDELQKIAEDAPPVTRAHLVAQSGELYLALNDEESARETVGEALKIAEKMYEYERDASKQGQTLKSGWASTKAWQSSISLAARISLDYATQIIAEVPDPEIRTFVKVAFGSTLLGVPVSFSF